MRAFALVAAGVVLAACNGSKGPAGAVGPSGPSGPPGPQGALGAQGPQGVPGPQGLQGIVGPQGIQGVAGPQGAQGLQGTQGPVGAKGLTWRGAWSPLVTYAADEVVEHAGSAWIALSASTGAQPPGPDWQLLAARGETGAVGATGPRGDIGPTGSQGAPGLQGPPGTSVVGLSLGLGDTQCPNGGVEFISVSGSAYVCNGADGLPGAQGVPGSKGDAGATGPRGAEGLQGIAGPSGPKGINWRGSFDSVAAYVVGDAVEHQGSSFVAVASTTGATPGTTGDWQVLAAGGASGPLGPSGPAGATGERGATGDVGPIGPPGAGSSAFYVEQDAYVAAHSGVGNRALIPGTQVTIPALSAPAVADLDAFGGAAIIGGGSGYLRCQVNVLLDGLRVPGIAYYLLPIPTGAPAYISHQMTPFSFIQRVALVAGIPHTIALELDSTMAGGAYCFADTLEPNRARFRITVR